MRQIILFPILLLVLVALSGEPAMALGTVRTTDGKTYDGDLRFDQDKLQITPRRGAALKVDLADLLYVSFHAPEPTRPQQPRGPGAELGQVPGNWRPQDVGSVGTPGDVRLYNGVYAVKGAGTNVSEKADEFFFVPQLLGGDVTLTARVVDLQQGDAHAKAGLMIRRDVNGRADEGAANLFLFVTPGEGTACFSRVERGNDTLHTAYTKQPIPVWLRVSRVRNLVTAWTSNDGLNWTQVEQREIVLDNHLLAGFAVCSHNRAGTLAASFDNVSVYSGPPRDDDTGRRPSPGTTSLNRAVLFRRGTVLANVQIQGMTDGSVKIIKPDGKPLTIPTTDISRLVLATLPASAMAKIPDRGTGVLLARGDFMEGEVQAISDARVRLSSVLFGLSNLAVGSEASVVALNDPLPSRSAWVVRATDGSVYNASHLRIEKDQLLIDDDSAGPVKVPSWNLLEIQAGEARSDSLSEMKPAKIDPGSNDPTRAYAAGASASLGLSLAETAAPTAVVTRAGTSVSYALDEKYKVFLCRAGVPEGTLPTVAVRFTVVVDGVEAYRSPPRTSLDEPSIISVSLTGAKTVMLHVDPLPAGLTASVLWADPLLMK